MTQSYAHETRAIGRGSKNILVVDDNVDAADSLALALKDMGHTVSVAYGGMSALRLSSAQRSDVILLDIYLPDIDGCEVARRLRAELGSGVNIVATTGFGGEELRQRALNAGFDHHIVKPIDPAFLQSLLG
jgi:CheY-like chemotaxis protein